MVVYEHEWSVDEPPAIVGELVTGLPSVNIELWEEDRPVTIGVSGCLEIGDTGRYSWSTANLGALPTTRAQYHYRMSDGGVNSVEGDFALQGREHREGGMPNLGDMTTYIQNT